MFLKAKSLKVFLLIIALMLTTVISSWSPLVAQADTFTQLNATQIVAAMGAGWNLGNQLEASIDGTPSETCWGNPTITQALINAVKAAGFKTIRIPVSYLSKIGPGPNYTIDSAWLARIKQVVDYAYSQGLYVIINMHGDGYTTVSGSWLLCNAADQTTIRNKYQKVWQQVANTFVNYNEHLIFESMNEEFDGTWQTPNRTYYSNINSYNQIFVDTVRQTGGNNSARWLLLPGWNTSIDYIVGDYGFVMPTDNYRSSSIPSNEKRIMLSVHYYTPWDFCGDDKSSITQYGVTATDPTKKSTSGQEDTLDSQFKSMYDTFVTQGYPFVVGEYGSIDKTYRDPTNNTYRAAFAKAVVLTAKKYGGVPVYWDNGANGDNCFGLFNRSTYAITQPGIVNAIMDAIKIDNGNTLKIKNVTTGLCIDGMYRTTNGDNCGQWSNGTSWNQRWVLEKSGYYYKFKNASTGLYLDGMGRTTAGSICGQWSSSTSNNQKWIIAPYGSNYRVKNVATGLYLDGGGNYTNGSDLKQWSDATSTNLQWQIVNP